MKTTNAFTLARTDRITLVVLLISLTCWEFTKWIWPQPPSLPISLITATPTEIEVAAHDREAVARHHGTDVDRKWASDANRTHPGTTMWSAHAQAPVDITHADADQLTAIGFPRHIARNIVKYREAGGQLRDSASLARIYGMSPDIWNKVADHVIFPARQASATTGKSTDHAGMPLDLNAATAEELEELPGIGPALAGRIIKYRSMLGGFHAVDQIGECYGMPPETVDLVRDRLRISTRPGRLPVNRVRLDTVYHPYAPRKVLRVIEAYKKQHGDLLDESDLRRAYPPDTAWIRRMLPYLDFSPREHALPLVTTNKPVP